MNFAPLGADQNAVDSAKYRNKANMGPVKEPSMPVTNSVATNQNVSVQHATDLNFKPQVATAIAAPKKSGALAFATSTSNAARPVTTQDAKSVSAQASRGFSLRDYTDLFFDSRANVFGITIDRPELTSLLDPAQRSSTFNRKADVTFTLVRIFELYGGNTPQGQTPVLGKAEFFAAVRDGLLQLTDASGRNFLGSPSDWRLTVPTTVLDFTNAVDSATGFNPIQNGGKTSLLNTDIRSAFKALGLPEPSSSTFGLLSATYDIRAISKPANIYRLLTEGVITLNPSRRSSTDPIAKIDFARLSPERILTGINAELKEASVRTLIPGQVRLEDLEKALTGMFGQENIFGRGTTLGNRLLELMPTYGARLAYYPVGRSGLPTQRFDNFFSLEKVRNMFADGALAVMDIGGAAGLFLRK